MATGGQSACDALAAAAADEVPPGLGPLAYALACASHTYSLAVLTLFSPIPLYWHAPLHLASTASMVWGARRLCATPLLQSPLAERLFRQLQLALRPLQLLVPVPLLPPPLDAPPDLCAASVSWLQVVLCFILPIYLRLRWDIRAMLQRAQQEGRALPSPSSSWHSWVLSWCYRAQRKLERTWGSRAVAALSLAGLAWRLCTLAAVGQLGAAAGG